MKSSVIIQELNRQTLVVDSVTPGSDVGEFGANKNNLLAGVMGALILRHCIHLSCVPHIRFSKQVGSGQLLSALDHFAGELAIRPDQALSVRTEDTLNYFLMFIANGSLESCAHVVQ